MPGAQRIALKYNSLRRRLIQEGVHFETEMTVKSLRLIDLPYVVEQR